MSSIITAIGLACLTMGNHRRSGTGRIGVGLLWVLAAGASSVGCASESGNSEDAFPRGADWGGQTGSLVPPTSGPSCGPVTGNDRILTLAGVASALLVTADGMDLATADAGATADHWYITDEDGEVIDLMDPAGEGTALLRPEEELAPGNYELNYRCGGVDQTVELVIEEPKPAPQLVENASLWYPPSEYTCESIEYSVSVSLTLGADSSALVDTAELTAEGDDFSIVVAPFASIEPDATTFEFAVPICRSAAETNCVPQMDTSLTVVTSFIDDTLPQHRVVLNLDANCDDEPPAEASPEPSMAPDEGACAIATHRARPGAPGWIIGLLLWAAWFRGRRRFPSLQRPPGSRQ